MPSGPVARKQSLFLGGMEPPVHPIGSALNPEHFPNLGWLGVPRPLTHFAITDNDGHLWMRTQTPDATESWVDLWDLATRYPWIVDVQARVLSSAPPRLGRAEWDAVYAAGADYVDNEGFELPDGTDDGLVYFEWQATGGFVPTPGRVTLDVRGLDAGQVETLVDAAIALHCPGLTLVYAFGGGGPSIWQWNGPGIWGNRQILNHSPSTPGFSWTVRSVGEDCLAMLSPGAGGLARLLREPWRTLSPMFCATEAGAAKRNFRGLAVAPNGDVYVGTYNDGTEADADQDIYRQVGGNGPWTPMGVNNFTAGLCAAPDGQIFASIANDLYVSAGGGAPFVATGWGTGNIGQIISVVTIPTGGGAYDVVVAVDGVGLYRQVGGVGNFNPWVMNPLAAQGPLALAPLTGDLYVDGGVFIHVIYAGTAVPVQLVCPADAYDGLVVLPNGDLLAASQVLRIRKNGVFFDTGLRAAFYRNMAVDARGRLLVAVSGLDVLRSL